MTDQEMRDMVSQINIKLDNVTKVLSAQIAAMQELATGLLESSAKDVGTFEALAKAIKEIRR